jgi:NADH-quinone oxidoreductase subunit L
LITVPLIILATLALSSGLLNATPFGESWERIKTWVEPSSVVVMTAPSDDVSALASGEESASEDGHHESPCGSETPKDGVCYAPQLKHAPFKWSKAAVSLIIVFAGLVISWLLCVALYTRKDKRLVGLTQRNAVLRGGYRLLDYKYYLDALYENVIVKAIVGPIAAGAYWFNQRILDGIFSRMAKGRIADIMGQTSGGQNITKICRIKVFETMPFDNLIAHHSPQRSPDTGDFQTMN